MSEFGGVRERRKFRENVDKSKVVRCSRYGNKIRMYVRLNGKPLEALCSFESPSRAMLDYHLERVDAVS